MILELNNYLFIVILAISIILISISYFINSRLILKDHTQKISNAFLVFFLANCISLALGRIFLIKYVFIVAGAPFLVFYGPLFYLYLRSIIDRGIVENRDYLALVHFLIPIGFTSFYLGSILVYNRLTIGFVQYYYFYLYFTSAVLLGFYAFYGFILLNKSNFYSAIRILTLRMIGLFFIVSMLLGSLVLYQHNPIYSQNLVSLGMLLFSIIIFFFYREKIKGLEIILEGDHKVIDSPTVLHVENTETFPTYSEVASINDDTDDSSVKYGKSKLSADILSLYDKKIQKVLVNEKAYLEYDFSVEKLCESTNVQRHHVAQVFSLVYDSNFNSYVNKMRIEYALEIISKSKNKQNVSELAERCGFNSRTSFFRAFKKTTQMSPTEYLDSINNNK